MDGISGHHLCHIFTGRKAGESNNVFFNTCILNEVTVPCMQNFKKDITRNLKIEAHAKIINWLTPEEPVHLPGSIKL